MATKRLLLERADSTLGKARDDEPLFILRGTDPLVPEVIEDWCQRFESTLVQGRERKIAAARQVKREIEAWQQANQTLVKLPA